MRRIICAGVILLVARITQRAVQRIVVVDVAVGTQARRHRVRARQSKSSSGVVERTIGPQHRVVAGFASRREACRDMVHRRQGVGVIVLVARDAGCTGQVVVVVNVAVRALTRRHGVRSRQHEASAVVIEGRIQP